MITNDFEKNGDTKMNSSEKVQTTNSENQKRQEQKFRQMTETPVNSLILKLSIPTILSMLITTIYNMADTYFVGKISTQATGAVGISFSVMAILQAVGFFFGHGSGNYISRMLGRRDTRHAEGMAIYGLVVCFISGIVIGALGLIFLTPLSTLLGSTETILPYTKNYLGIILLATPFTMSSFVLNNQLRFQGRASMAMVGIVTGGVLNIILDPIFIFSFKLGIKGAALATITGQIISFLILLTMSLKKGSINLSLKNLSINRFYLLEVTRGGFPSLCRQGLGSVATICLNHSAAIYGDAAIAAMSVVTRIILFANSALIGFGQGFQPVCGYNYGAKLYKRVSDGFIFCVKYSFIFLLCVALAFFSFPDTLIGFFRDDAEVIKIGAVALKFQCITLPLSSFIVLSNMMLQSMGLAKKATIVASAKQGLFFIPLILILPRFFGLTGVEICQMVSDICSFCLTLPISLSVLRELKRGQAV